MDLKALNAAEREIYDEAERLIRRGTSAAEFSARCFGPDGLLRNLWKSDADRKVVVASDLYHWLKSRLADLRRQEAEEFERTVATLSGRMTVVVPKSLHAALKREAAQEGVSLSELIRLKLGVAYRDIANLLVSHEHPEPAKRRAV